MKLYEQLKLINKYTSVVIECHYKNKTEYYDGRVEVEAWSETLHNGELKDMDFVKFLEAMYYEVDEIFSNKSGSIIIECHHEYKD